MKSNTIFCGHSNCNIRMAGRATHTAQESDDELRTSKVAPKQHRAGLHLLRSHRAGRPARVSG
jgi:hypothetical protein